MAEPKKTGKKLVRGPGGRFISGNKSGGRPKGSRNKTTIIAEQLLDGKAEKIVETAIHLALSGEVTALRLCLERILPPRKERPLQIDLPKIETAEDLPKATMEVFRSVSKGFLTPSEGTALLDMLERYGEALSRADGGRSPIDRLADSIASLRIERKTEKENCE